MHYTRPYLMYTIKCLSSYADYLSAALFQCINHLISYIVGFPHRPNRNAFVIDDTTTHDLCK